MNQISDKNLNSTFVSHDNTCTCMFGCKLQHLGLLRVGDAMVFYALKERMRNDEDQRVRYEAAKSLILVGKDSN